MGIRGEPSIPEMGDFQIHNCWIPDTPGKPILAKPQPICGDNGKNQANGMCTNSSERQKGLHDWEIYLREKTVQDGVAATATTRQGNVNAASSSSESIFKTGFEGTRFEASFTNSLPDNKFISVGPNFWVNSSCLPNTPIHGNSIPSRHNYDLNSPSKGLTDAFSSGNMYFQFAPITPDQSRKEENKQGKEVSTRDGSDDIHHDQEKQLLNDSSSTAVSTQVQENHNPDTDLQKTPQQKSRRKKHRPKVVREGKQKRTRRPATPKSVENKETPTGKRKYVRKNKVQETPDLPTVEVTPSAENKESPTGKRKYVRKKGVNKTQGLPKVEVTSKCTDTKTELHKEKSCRKRLNFDHNSPTIEESFPCRPESNGNGESQAQNFHIRVEPEPTVQLGQASELMAEKTKAHLTNDSPKAHEQNECKRGKCRIVFSNQTHDKQESSVQLMMKNNARAAPSLNDTNCSTEAGLCKGEAARGLKRGHECTKNEAEPRCTSATGGGYNSVRRGDDPTIDEAEPRCTNAIGGCYNSVHEYLAVLPAEVYDATRISGMHFSATDKKKRTKRRHSTTASSTSSSETAAEYNVKEATACTFNNACVASYTPDTNFTNSAAQFNTTSIQTKTSLLLNLQLQQQVFACKMALDQKRRMKEMGSNKATGACSLASLVGSELALDQTRRMTEMRSNIATQVCSLASLVGSELALDQTRMKTQMISNIATQVYSLASLIGTVECNQVPISSAEGASLCGDLQMCVSSHPHHACVERMVPKIHTTRRKKRTKRNSVANEMSTDATQKEIPTVDVITKCLKHLHISPKYNGQNALVLYHRVGTVVPSESFQPIRKRRPRAKVDIDTETNRVWRLLLENINNEGIDGTDEEKAKWWEEERRVFQGRADSFIARMHLVQGDRRFTPWKGSVVDSVVGVFLTQNVSDHLSSSAFMSLAAHFPFKTKGGFCPCSKETSILVKEPEAHILEPADTISRHQEKLNQTAQNRSSIAIQVTDTMVGKGVVNHNDFPESSSNGANSTAELKNEPSYSSRNDPEMFLNSTANKGAFQQTEAVANFRGEMSDIVSSKHSTGNSQNCEDSSMAPNGKQIGSYLREKSEAMQVNRSNPSFMELLHMAVRGFPNQETEGISSYKENEQDYMNESEDATQNFNHRSYSPKTSIRPIIPSTIPDLGELEVPSYEMLGEETPSSNAPNGHEENSASEQSEVTVESVSQAIVQKVLNVSFQEASKSVDDINHACSSLQRESNTIFESEYRPLRDPKDILQVQTEVLNYRMQQEAEAINLSKESLAINSCTIDNPKNTEHTVIESSIEGHGPNPGSATSELKRRKAGKQKENPVDWDILRLQAQEKGKREKTTNTMDSLDWEAVWQADVDEVANTIKARGMNNVLAGRIKDFLNRLVREHGSIDLEWLRDVPPDKAKEYLLSVRGLGLKSVECVRLLTLHHLAFPVDTNVGRIAVRLGWVPLQPLPESLQLHLLELYPVLESIQQYLWPRLCKLDQRTLYELHYQMITFGKVFCTKSKPNCNACPMRGECRHFASAFASARLALPGPEEKSIMNATEPKEAKQSPVEVIKPLQLPLPQPNLQLQAHSQVHTCQPIVEVPTTPIVEEPIVEVPTTPEPELQAPESDIEDAFFEDPEDIPTIKLNIEEFTQNLQNYMEQNMELQDGDMSKALVALTQEAASIPMPKLKNVSQLRTEHQVYELPDSHPLLEGLDRREPDDPCSYLLAIWTPGETASSINQPENRCSYQESGELCDEKTCFSCNSIREANSQTVRGTLLIPCRTAMRGSFPLNGTYFQVNEVFADHESSINPIDVPRAWIWNLPRRIVYFGTSIPTIFKGLSTESIQYCFWRGFVCVRGFDQKTRAPRPLMARLHFPASKLPRTGGKTDEKKD